MPTYKYPRPAVTADILLFAPDAEGHTCVLLIQRGNDPFQGCWAFPGGFLDEDETIEQCAQRELQEETGITLGTELKQLHVFSAPDRDPRGRTLTVAFVAELDYMPTAVGADDAAAARWFALDALPPLAFDHDQILQFAQNR